MKDNTTWSKVIEYINTHNDEFSPRDLRSIESPSIYTYLNYFRIAGFLSRHKRGIYKRIQHVPEDLTITNIIKICYRGDKKIMRQFKLNEIQEKIEHANAPNQILQAIMGISGK